MNDTNAKHLDEAREWNQTADRLDHEGAEYERGNKPTLAALKREIGRQCRESAKKCEQRTTRPTA